MKAVLTTIIFLYIHATAVGQSVIADKVAANTFLLDDAVIYYDPNDFAVIRKSAELLQKDIELVTGTKPMLVTRRPVLTDNIIVIGSIEKSRCIKELISTKKINPSSVKNKWEAFQLQTISNPFTGYKNAIVITGSDRRGAAFGVFELSKQLGVSPWYWWADVPVPKKKLILKKNVVITDAPLVKYRGIFINDEAPALSNWSKEKFGGFNHLFYEKVFELMLRLKANYLWPAMWGNAFYHDDSLNSKTADEYAIVIGTSHHEPMMRAHEEWKYEGNGRKWNYDSTESGLREYWKVGIQRAWNEKIVSIGMRGDGDEPMSRETATTLLERIVHDQRQIIETVTGMPAAETPQLWALYKEVQDYYDKGMRVPDDVTLLLCDDNWGNIRKLPKRDEKPRKGGYGIYYHFDYVGGPRNYKWVNTNPLPRIWEQMHLAWAYHARQIWIVNVGDIKPMELPISFFLDYAWNPEKIDAGDLQKYTEQWAAAQFGQQHAKPIANILSKYAKYNSRRKPELLDEKTYSLQNFDEFSSVVADYDKLFKQADSINNLLPAACRDAYFQLVLHPVKACANLNKLYLNVALNDLHYRTTKNHLVKIFADRAKENYLQDSLITVAYHQLNKGKWNHMMSQAHIGYTYWQQPPFQTMPTVRYLPPDSVKAVDEDIIRGRYKNAKNLVPATAAGNIYYEEM